MPSSSAALVRRGRRNAGYTAISNALIDHPTLSTDARLLLVYLLSKPDDWELRIADVRRFLGAGATPCGRNKSYEVIRELKDTAYVVAASITDDQGKFERVVYVVHDEPHPDPDALRRELRGETASISTGSDDIDAGETPPLEPCLQNRDAVRLPCPPFRYPVKGDSTKKGIEQKTESPHPPPKHPASAVERKFDELWGSWPSSERPDKRTVAERQFERLTAAERTAAIEHAGSYRRREQGDDRIGLMIPYLRQRLWTEFDGAPPLDSDGYFVVTPDRPEWAAWIAAIGMEYGERAVESSIRFGRILRRRRWPEPAAHQIGDTGGAPAMAIGQPVSAFDISPSAAGGVRHV